MQGQMRLEGQVTRLEEEGGQPRHPSAGQCAQAWGAAAATGVGRRRAPPGVAQVLLMHCPRRSLCAPTTSRGRTMGPTRYLFIRG